MAGTRLAAECRLSPRYVYHLLKVATAVGLLVRLDHGSRKGARYLLACPGGTDGATRIAGAIKTRAARLAGLGKACTYRSTNPRARRVGDSAFVSTQARDMVAHHPWLAHEIARVLDQDAHVPEGGARVVTDILDRAPRRGRVRDPVAYVRAAVRRDPARYRDLWPGAQVDVQATTRVAGMVAAVSQRLRT